MEDMARLALLEQDVRDAEKFSKILYELLRHINYILENPHDYELRTIKSEVLTKVLHREAFISYLKSIGFQSVENEYTYPKEHTLGNLRMAQAALERKIVYCYGSVNRREVKVRSSHSLPQVKKPTFTPLNVLNTDNPLLVKIQLLFNSMIAYESEELQEAARENIPMVKLQLMALDRVREHQRKLKAGEIKGLDLSFDIALLMELLGWFKYKFFTWVDKPPCKLCGGPTVHRGTRSMMTETETCNVELYKCTRCKEGAAEFPRYNDARTLLRTRRGRCGEWTNCFALLCRALGYDTRYVYDTTDHVWCEVFDFDSNKWLHVDPSEGVLNAPLIYSHGWRKQLSYVIALSRDDLQDVTWRYTTGHREVLKRRTACDEQALISAILTLREHRQRQVSEARRRYLAKRCLEELVQMQVESKPSDYECHGRISGSKEWRTQRGETGTQKGHVFQFDRPGSCSVRYYPAADRYRVEGGGEQRELPTWAAGVYEAENVFRKVETDWRMVYLAREEGETSGSISWKLSTKGDRLAFDSLSIALSCKLYETGSIAWSVTFDGGEPVRADLGESPTVFACEFRSALLRGELAGGVGDVAWQHAQLFRHSVDADGCALEVLASVRETH